MRKQPNAGLGPVTVNPTHSGVGPRIYQLLENGVGLGDCVCCLHIKTLFLSSYILHTKRRHRQYTKCPSVLIFHPREIHLDYYVVTDYCCETE